MGRGANSQHTLRKDAGMDLTSSCGSARILYGPFGPRYATGMSRSLYAGQNAASRSATVLGGCPRPVLQLDVARTCQLRGTACAVLLGPMTDWRLLSAREGSLMSYA